MRSRLSRLLQIVPLQELHPADLTESHDASFEDLSATLSETVERDDAVFLLQTIAEVEHALMIQYLFAAYSLKTADIPENKGRLTAEQQALVNEWRCEIIKIATEEMGHLASVQNLLHLIGGPLNFEREDFPFRSGLYPFRFRLEPLSINSLAKYVYAEMPENLKDEDIPEGLTRTDINDLKCRAVESNMNDPLIHVGRLFALLTNLFQRLTEFAENSEFLQADDRWKQGHDNLKIKTVKCGKDALMLIDEIAGQGEGLEDTAHSHFRRFIKIYADFLKIKDWQPSLNIAANPNTIPEEAIAEMEADADLQKDLKNGGITNLKSRLWAQLLNARYRMLLIDISHALHLRTNDDNEKIPRKILTRWAFGEMLSNINNISRLLTMMPLKKGDDAEKLCAGPPFELPYTLNLPIGEPNRWRLHQDMIRSSQMLTAKILAEPEPDKKQKKYLKELAVRDAKDLEQAKNPNVDLDDQPREPNMNRFSEVNKILENAVDNLPIGEHGNFWRDRTRDQFIDFSYAGQKIIKINEDGTFDEDESNLIKALEGRAPFGSAIGTSGATFPRMPVGFSPVPQDKIDFIRNWIKDGCPDDGEVQPPSNALSFAADIKNLFREDPDRLSMLDRFDLHKFEDVRDRADRILEKLQVDMPCDGLWSDEQIAVFRKWITDGKNP